MLRTCGPKEPLPLDKTPAAHFSCSFCHSSCALHPVLYPPDKQLLCVYSEMSKA